MAKKGISGFIAGIKKVAKGIAPFASIAKSVLALTPIGAGLNIITKTIGAAKGIKKAIDVAKAVKGTVDRGKQIAAALKASGVTPTPQKVATVAAAADSKKPVAIATQATVLKRAEAQAQKAQAEAKPTNKEVKVKPAPGKKGEFFALFDEGPGAGGVTFLADTTTLTFFKAEKKAFLDNIEKVDKNLDTLKGKIKRIKDKPLKDNYTVQHSDLETALKNFKAEIKSQKTIDDETSTPYILLTPASARAVLKTYQTRLEGINKDIIAIDKKVDDYFDGKMPLVESPIRTEEQRKIINRDAKATGAAANKTKTLVMLAALAAGVGLFFALKGKLGAKKR